MTWCFPVSFTLPHCYQFRQVWRTCSHTKVPCWAVLVDIRNVLCHQQGLHRWMQLRSLQTRLRFLLGHSTVWCSSWSSWLCLCRYLLCAFRIARRTSRPTRHWTLEAGGRKLTDWDQLWGSQLDLISASKSNRYALYHLQVLSVACRALRRSAKSWHAQ